MAIKLTLFTLFLFGITQKVLGQNTQEDDSSGILISEDLREGRYLIYKCNDKHYACVDKDSYDQCKNIRGKDIKKKEVDLSCWPLKAYKNQQACFIEQKKLINKALDKKYCSKFENIDLAN